MSKDNGTTLTLTGDGAAYIRVSDNQQDTLRQFDSIHAFEKRHKVTIPTHQWFKDEGWARDTADRRPEFQRLVKQAEAGQVRWIVVDQLDRFGTKNSRQLIVYLYRLDEAGCKLYDTTGKEWTGEDIATVITAVVEGDKSKGEQTSKSHRILGGKVTKARLGEWQGGPVRLGFDVGCYHRETVKELWRVVFEGRDKRLKLYPDGRGERFDGPRNFPRFQELTEMLRIAPSGDQSKLDAVTRVFQRFATESISLTALAHDLNKLGFRTNYGGCFQGQQIEEMLKDANYLGYYTYNRTHNGKFHRYAGGQMVPDLNYEEKASKIDSSDWVYSQVRLFPPLIDQPTWDAVQRKLARSKEKRINPPRSAALYLNGLVYCDNCGARMIAGRGKSSKRGSSLLKFEFVCSSYRTAVRYKKRQEGTCLRNGVYQHELEEYVERYLEETGKRLELLTRRPDRDHLTERLEGQQSEAWRALCEGIDRLTGYLAQHHPAEFAVIVEEDRARRAEGRAEELASRHSPGTPSGVLDRFGDSLNEAIKEAVNRPISVMPSDPYVSACLDAYRANFDPAAIDAEIKRLDAEHDRQSDLWANPPRPGTRSKATKRLLKLEADIEELKRQRGRRGRCRRAVLPRNLRPPGDHRGGQAGHAKRDRGTRPTPAGRGRPGRHPAD